MPTSVVESIHPRAGRRRVGRAVFGAAVLAAAVVLPAGTSGAATAVGLGTASSFGVLGASTVTNTGPTVVNGDLGVSPGSAVTGFADPGGPGTVTPPGTIHENDAVAAQAQKDALTAGNALAAQACDTVLTGKDLGGLTLTPGVYCFSSSAQLTGALTLNALGDPAAAFVFQIGSTLTTASDSSVLFTNSFESCNVFWRVGSSATLGTSTDFVGTVIASESITATTGATVEGRLLALNGAVTLDTNVITPTTCAAAVDEPPVDEEPVDETPVDEPPVDEEPVDETPVDETPVDETPVDGSPVESPAGGAGSGTPLAPGVPAGIPAGPLAAGPPVIVTGGPAAPAGPTGAGVPRLADTGSSPLLAGAGLLAILAGSTLVLLADPKRTPARTRRG